MPAVSSSAPGKVILLGEHAVVYGYPALAIPLTEISARAVILPLPLAPPGTIKITAPNIHLESTLHDLADDDPLGKTLRLAEGELGGRIPSFQIRITSSIPMASGLGSGAAVSAAVLRAVSSFAGKPFDDETVNRLTFEVEKLHHGTPSGVDNTVVTYSRPVYFKKDHHPERLKIGGEFSFVVADTGIVSSTSLVVGDVRQSWLAEPFLYNSFFSDIGALVDEARRAVEAGNPDMLGRLMNTNQTLLEKIGVSSPQLEVLISAARDAGAMGAKLSGAGRGGIIIALVDPGTGEAVKARLQNAGAVRVLTSTLQPDQ